MAKVSCDVAIVGGGPTGLTLANLLGQLGVSVMLIEKRNGTVTEPRAVSVGDDSLRIIGRDANNTLEQFLQGADAAVLLIVRLDGYEFGATQAALEALHLFAAKCRSRLRHVNIEVRPIASTSRNTEKASRSGGRLADRMGQRFS
jgi:monoamine oxidase